ncbi:MAG: nucleoside hydrolase [Armatimonadota bacterium]|nr:MAG: nucleoside hydrolase [Armatimonadota bacterium]
MVQRSRLVLPIIGVLLVTVLAGATAAAEEKAQMPERIILDTDIGDDIDDAYCLSLILSCPELELEGVVTVYGPVQRRAQIARKLLRVAGRDDIPVVPGKAGRGDPEAVPNQHPWAEGEKTPSGDGVAFVVHKILQNPGEISLLAVGALTNVAAVLDADARIAGAIKRIFIMGGSVYRGYNGSDTPAVEWNIRCDPAAARTVLAKARNLYVAPLDISSLAHLRAEHLDAIAASDRPLARAMAELLPYWRGDDAQRRPCLFDPLTAALMIEASLAKGREMRIEVTDEGMTVPAEGEPNAFVYLEPNLEPFFEFYVRRLASEPASPRTE